MNRRSLLAVMFAVSFLNAIPAMAEPILYTFTATLSVSKTTENPTGGDTPAGAFEDAYWFPTLHHGDVYNATGWLEYDPSLLADTGWLDAPLLAYITINDHTFSIASNLGFASFGNSLTIADSFPAVVSGPMPDSVYIGEDAVMTLFNSTAPPSPESTVPPTLDGFTHGTVLSYGSGHYVPGDGSPTIQTRLLWRGSINEIQRVPEPATLVLAGLGSVFLLYCRRSRATGSRG
jgi:hypothetical protein